MPKNPRHAAFSIEIFDEVVQCARRPNPRQRRDCSGFAWNEEQLRHEKDFSGVGIFHFGPRREAADVDVTLIWRIRTGDKTSLARHRNSIRDVAFGRFGLRGSSCGRLRWRFLPRHSIRRRRRSAVRIVRLRFRWVFTLNRRLLIASYAMAGRPNRRLVFACGKKKECTEKGKRELKFHKSFSTSVCSL